METFSVSQFVEFLNVAFDSAVFPEGVSVEGEVIEYRVSQNKWIWFGLKDDSAVVWCFATVWGLRQPLEDGMRIRAYGHPKIHPKSGKFSLNVQKAEAVGEGAMRRSFEMLRQKLEKEGVFSLARKRSLPKFPSRIGLITSSESAAYGDFMRILNDRWSGVEVVLADVQVQGKYAVEQITGAFDYFSVNDESVDLIVLTRGGGSLEDLQAFNTEEVCRAVFAAGVPVVVGVGHERDITLADLAADLRAATPSNAAELIFPDRREVIANLNAAVSGMTLYFDGRLARHSENVGRLAVRLESWLEHPMSMVKAMSEDLCCLFSRQLVSLRSDLESKIRFLGGVDPNRVLKLGYSIVQSGGRIVRSSSEVMIGQDIEVKFAKGGLTAEVKKRKI